MMTIPKQPIQAFDDSAITGPASFLDELTEILNAASRGKGTTLALVVLKVLETERISATLGMLAADEVIRRCTAKIRHELDDRAAVYRIGSDKLAVVIFDIRNEGHAVLAAHKIRNLINQPLVAAAQKIRLSCAQGVSLFPAHGRNAVDLIRSADSALHGALTTNEHIHVHRDNHTSGQSHRWELEQHVEHILSEGDLLVAFDPKIHLDTNAIRGAESLLCFEDSAMSPEQFIDIAEQMGRTFDVTSVVLNAALRHACEWHESGNPIGVSVNIESSLIRSGECIDLVADALKIWSVPNGTLTLEVTENTFLEDSDSCCRTLETLRNMGVHLSIDDFGTGFSCLSNFRNIPARELKIHKAIVTDMLHDPANARVVRAAIDLAHAFGADVVAEGVEDDATLEELRALGCDLVQGPLVTQPLVGTDFLNWQNRWQSHAASAT